MSAILKDLDSGLRAACEYDLAEILAIEQAAYDFPWTEGLLRDCLTKDYYFCLLVEQQEIIGYGIMSCVMDEAHILNICIDPQWQGQGRGKRLLFHLLDIARKYKAKMAFLEVRISNAIAQQLYESNGFDQYGTRKDYYPMGRIWEDAVLYAKTL